MQKECRSRLEVKNNMAYGQMGYVYDPFMKGAPYDKWLTFTREMIRKSGIAVQKVADLGCGTGELTIKLAKEGYQLLGVDYSIDMLTHADQKSRQENLDIQWIHQDLRELEGLDQLDVAVSFCDVMNYITSKSDLKNVVERIAKALKPGGLFMFDIHSLDYVSNYLVNNSFTEVTDDLAYIWDCIAGDQPGEMYHELTFFTLENDGKYDRIDEFHHQRTYSAQEYKKILTAAGFENPVLYSDFSLKSDHLTEKTERIFIVTKKRSE